MGRVRVTGASLQVGSGINKNPSWTRPIAIPNCDPYVICPFFLKGNMRTIINEIRKKHIGCSWWWTQKSINSKQKRRSQEPSLIEEKTVKEEQSVKPQHWDQSKSQHWHKSFYSTNIFSEFSKKRRLCSNKIVHVKQPGIKFQIHIYIYIYILAHSYI